MYVAKGLTGYPAIPIPGTTSKLYYVRRKQITALSGKYQYDNVKISTKSFLVAILLAYSTNQVHHHLFFRPDTGLKAGYPDRRISSKILYKIDMSQTQK